jgi:signal transduction histidine kinase/CheY-like chemotaxis protein
MPKNTTAADWLVGSSEIVQLIRSKDWSQTQLGAIETWPESLQTTVSLCLASSFPVNLAWGPGYVQIWNEGYSRVSGDKHPGELGSDYRECWASAWPAIGGAFETACAGETAYLRDLASRAGHARSVTEAALSLEVLAGFELDLPFLLLYLGDEDRSRARLVGHTGLQPGHRLSPPVIELASADACAAVTCVLHDGRTVHVTDLVRRFGPVHAGPHAESIEQALMLPIALPGVERPVGVLVAGISTRLPLDDTYLGFLALVGAGVSNAVAHATAYEQQRRRAEALAEIDTAKTAFFSNVSHEFRTPLTLMLGPLEEALDAPSLERRQRERLETVHRNSLRLLRLVNSILDFSRVESGRMGASYVPTDLAAYTTDLASLFRSATQTAGLDLVVECDPLPQPLFVDRDMWEKIVLNLLSNAFKHTFSGAITVTLTWNGDGDGAELAVADTGVGIAADELPKLFERFHRVRDARSRTYEGTGIGLSLVQQLARLHGGDVRIDSEEDRGSTFTVTVRAGHAHLPAEQVGNAAGQAGTTGLSAAYADEALRWLSPDDLVAAGADLPVAELSDNGGPPRPRVLLADDNADMRAHLRRLLEPRFEIVAVGDGAAALEAALRHPPNLVLTDVMMPHLDGFGLLAAMPSVSVEAAEQPRADSNARTILYVEDNPSNVKLVERVLALRPEIRLVVAMRGALGVDLAREHDPCLILLDLNLPDISGEEVLRRLKLDPQTIDIPVVVISADATPGQRARLQAKGAADYLSKPFEVAHLLQIVDETALPR